MDENSFCSTFLAAITFTNVQVLTFLIGVQHFIVSEFAISCWHMRLSIFAHIPNNCHLYAFFFCGGCEFKSFDLSKKMGYFVIVEFYEFFVDFGDQPFVRYTFCWDFLPACVLSFYSLNTSFDRAEKFNFNESLSYCFFFKESTFAVIFSHH